MLELPTVTLVCIDRQPPALALAAIEQTLIRCRCAGVLFVSDRPNDIEGLNAIHVPDLGSSEVRARFIARDLAAHVASSHALLIGWDAFVIDPDGWTDAFLQYDVVLPRRKPGSAPPSSTGIALLSRDLLERMRTADVPEGIDPLTTLQSPDFMPDARRPPVELRERFAFGDYAPVGSPFGFERLFNMWLYFQPADLQTFIAMAPAEVLASRDALSLAINLHALGRVDDAAKLLQAIVGANPSDPTARNVLDAIGGRQPVVVASTKAAPVVGRNDPCPCGSGRRYKQCHGALGATAVPSSLPAAAMNAAGAAATAGTAAPSVPSAAAGPGTSFTSTLPQADGAAAVWMRRAREAFRRNEKTADSLHRRALEVEPDNAEATSYLGVIAMRENRDAEAGQLLKRAVLLAPHNAEYHNNLGMFHQMRGNEAQALTAYADAIRLDPHDATAHNNLGLLLQEMARPQAAIAAFRRAIESVPAFADAHWNLALALLAVGDFEHGLDEQEWRLRAATQRESWERRARFPMWRGEPLHGKRLLVLAEQGLGDIIQYVRYAVALAERGATVIVEAPAELTALLRTTRGVAMVAPLNGPHPPCDYQVPVMSLPCVSKTRLDSIPAPVPYILPDLARTARWKALVGEKSRARIGINWSGNPLQVRNRTRSLPLAMLEPLLERSDIEFFSLHKGRASDQITALRAGITLRDLMPRADDFADTAALIGELDLVITTDTGVAHLAGALGAPTLLLLDAAPDCRWLLERNDSPWYPTMRLIRQKRRGDWRGVVAEVVREVEQRFGVPAATTEETT